MEKKILLPTDFSKNALNAARYTVDIFREDRCIFYVLNVFHATGYSLDNMMMVPEPGEMSYEVAREQSEKGLVKFLGMLKLHPANPLHRFKTISVFNSLLEGVRQGIEKQKTDLVVMGTRGATDAERVLFGTNTVHVMENIQKCPVLAVPAGYQYTPPSNIVFPTAFEAELGKRDLKILLQIAATHHSTIHVLHMGAEPDKEQKRRQRILNRILEGFRHEYHTLDETNVAKGINTFLSERPCNLIVFMNRRHSFLQKLLSRPLVKELGYHSQIPILELNVPV